MGAAHSCSALQEALDLRLIRSYVFDMNGIFHTPKRFALLLLAAFALANGPVWAAPTPVADKGGDKKEEAVWGEMPAGAKTTYIGIHGGTVPVSLLTAGDGSPDDRTRGPDRKRFPELFAYQRQIAGRAPVCRQYRDLRPGGRTLRT